MPLEKESTRAFPITHGWQMAEVFSTADYSLAYESQLHQSRCLILGSLRRKLSPKSLERE
jgi:hypothetical protein